MGVQLTVIHYDAVTEVGVGRDSAGQPHYFSRHELPLGFVIRPGAVIEMPTAERLIRADKPKPAPTPIRAETPIPKQAQTSTHKPAETPAPSVVVRVPKSRLSGLNWLGFGVSLLLVQVLWMLGQQLDSDKPSPSLLDSWTGTLAALLLLWQAIGFGMKAAGRRLQRQIWLIVGFAIIFQGCHSFREEGQLSLFDTLLVISIVLTYVLPNLWAKKQS